MVDACFKKYKDFQDFVTDFLFVVMEEEYSMIIVNYADYQGLIQALNSKVVNGKSLTLNCECYDNFDLDVDTAKNNSGNMLVTVIKDSGEIIGEPLLYTDPKSYVTGTYFVENDAKSALDIPFEGCIIPFQIEKVKL